MFLKCVVQREVAVRTGEAALFVSIKEGTQKGKEEKIVLTGIESW
jgi:hypothetical protein